MTEPEEVPIPERLPDASSWQRADFRTGRGPKARYVTMAMRHGHPVAYVWTARTRDAWPEIAFEFTTEGLLSDAASADALAAATAAEAAEFVADELGVPPAWADAMAGRIRSSWRPATSGAGHDRNVDLDFRERA